MLDGLIERLRSEGSRSTGSLVITIYGDAVAPRGGSLWLGTLADILKGAGVESGAVRTAMSRLAADGWLERARLGRQSFYRLADKGRAAFAAATQRIYFAAPHAWDGTLRLAVFENGERGAQRADLEAQGFGSLAPGVMLAAEGGLGPGGDPILLEARTDAQAARRLAARAWPLERIAESYRRFLGAFAPAEAALRRGEPLDELSALILRVLVIHEYRRVILRDPLLPEELLPPEWPGHEARALCGRLYRALVPPSERWLDRHGRSEAGALPPAEPSFHARFRDLPDAHTALYVTETA